MIDFILPIALAFIITLSSCTYEIYNQMKRKEKEIQSKMDELNTSLSILTLCHKQLKDHVDQLVQKEKIYYSELKTLKQDVKNKKTIKP